MADDEPIELIPAGDEAASEDRPATGGAGRTAAIAVVAVVVVLALIAGGVLWSRRTSTDTNPEVASGTPADVMRFLSESTQGSLDANTFVSTMTYELTSTDPQAQPFYECTTSKQRPVTRAVDLDRGVSVLMDVTNRVPVSVTSPDIDAFNAAVFPEVPVPTAWVSYNRFDTRLLSTAFVGDRMRHVVVSAYAHSHQTTPQQMLEVLLSASSNVTVAGSEPVGTVATTRLNVTLDGAKLDEANRRALDASKVRDDEIASRRGVAPLDESSRADRPPSTRDASADVWVSSDRLVRKLALRFTAVRQTDSSAPQPDGLPPGDVRAEATVTYDKFGEPLPVDVSAADTTALGSLPALILLAPSTPSSDGTDCTGSTGSTLTNPAEAAAFARFQACQREEQRKFYDGKTVDEALAATTFKLGDFSVPCLGNADGESTRTPG